MSLMDLNLLPSGAKFQAAKVKLQKQVRLVIIWIAAGWVAVAVVVFGLTMLVKFRIATAQTQYKKAESDYMAMSDNIITSQLLKYRAKTVSEVLDKRFEYGKAFEAINNLFPAAVTISNFQLEDQGGFQLSAATSGGANMDQVEAVVADINNGNNDEFKAAKLTTLSYDNDDWTFNVEVDMK